MKKSKVIVPALGLLLLSTAASVSGTVAWFTATRTATTSTGNFAVVKTDGELEASITPGVGTSATGTTVNPVTNGKIGDVSFNPATHQLWTDTGDGRAYRTIGDNDDWKTLPSSGTAEHVYRINDTTYYAFTWKVTLTYTWGADLTTLNIFFDYAQDGTGSSMTASAQGSGTLKNETSKGMRVAMMADMTGGRTVVYAGLQNAQYLEGVASSSTHPAYGTTGLTSDTFSYFASDKYAKGSVAADAATAKASYAKAVDGQASQTSREDYLGQIVHSGSSDHLDIYCVAWFEGTDPQVVNNKEMEQVQSTIKFYAATNA